MALPVILQYHYVIKKERYILADVCLSIPFGTAAGSTAGSFFGPLTLCIGAVIGSAIGLAVRIAYENNIPSYQITAHDTELQNAIYLQEMHSAKDKKNTGAGNTGNGSNPQKPNKDDDK